MKISRIIFAAALAAMTMASCQKQEPASENQNLKSVEIKISNVFSGTKAIGGLDYDLEGKNIQLNSLQFFFSDGTTLYEAKNVNQEKADVYFNAEKLSENGIENTRPWFGQLMKGPQVMAFLIQVNNWLKEYKIRIV